MPVTRFLARQPDRQRRRHASAWSTATRSRWSSASSTPSGLDLTEDAQRKIERLFNREDFRRVFPGEIGDIGFPPRALEHYTAALEATVDVERPGRRPLQGGRRLRLRLARRFVMPNVLAKLGADVLGVNPYASTAGAMALRRRRRTPSSVAALVRPSGAHLGAVIDPDGEHLTLIDDEGRVLTDTQALLAFLTPAWPSRLVGDRVALPVTATAHADGHRRRRTACAVRWTKLSTAGAHGRRHRGPGVGFAASLDGGFILPGFLPAFDAAAVAGEAARAAGPAAAHACPRSSTRCPTRPPRPRDGRDPVGAEGHGHAHASSSWPRTATVELVDGVKVLHDDGWALALPDPEEPVTHVWAEGATDADARRLAQEYARRIRQMLR